MVFLGAMSFPPWPYLVLPQGFSRRVAQGRSPAGDESLVLAWHVGWCSFEVLQLPFKPRWMVNPLHFERGMKSADISIFCCPCLWHKIHAYDSWTTWINILSWEIYHYWAEIILHWIVYHEWYDFVQEYLTDVKQLFGENLHWVFSSF